MDEFDDEEENDDFDPVDDAPVKKLEVNKKFLLARSLYLHSF